MSGEEYRTKSGKILTDVDIEKLADEAEEGYDIEHLLPKRYMIIENTPGYLPDNDDPLTFDSYAEALNELVRYNLELREESGFDLDLTEFDLYEVEPIVNGQFSYYNLSSAGKKMPHNLGRNVEIVLIEEGSDG